MDLKCRNEYKTPFLGNYISNDRKSVKNLENSRLTLTANIYLFRSERSFSPKPKLQLEKDAKKREGPTPTSETTSTHTHIHTHKRTNPHNTGNKTSADSMNCAIFVVLVCTKSSSCPIRPTQTNKQTNKQTTHTHAATHTANMATHPAANVGSTSSS